MMKTKVGRNDPCPCGSGRKYKRCCGNSVRVTIDEGAPTDSSAEVPEELVISSLLHLSPEFRAMYDVERMRIHGKVIWSVGTTLPQGVLGATDRVQSRMWRIRLRAVPVRQEDAFNVAHELMHAVLDCEGFPDLVIDERLRPSMNERQTLHRIGAPLCSMLLDPVANERLRSYGFDLWLPYVRETEFSICQIKTSGSPPNRLTELAWIINCASNLIDWRLSRPPTAKEPSEFQKWFDPLYPRIAVEARQVVDLVAARGYETPQTMVVLLRELISAWRLTGVAVTL
jgi:hypothetical protein